MRVVGSNFSVNLQVCDGVVVAADRPVRYMKGWPLTRVQALAQRWHWKILYNERERAEQDGEPPSAGAQ